MNDSIKLVEKILFPHRYSEFVWRILKLKLGTK